MTHKTIVFMALVTEYGEDEGVEFTVALPFVPELGSVLSFEGTTDVDEADFIDIVKMRVDEKESHYALVQDKIDGGYRSELVVEINSSYLGKNPRSGQAIVDTLKQHSSVSEIGYPV